ncbi:MAG: replication initiator protein [Microviridae sp.]|nr:MAG: replication initiator protein [Microviridae sp.]
MGCLSRVKVINAGELVAGKVYNSDVMVPCGKCPACKLRRVNDWVIRLTEEERHHKYAMFLTLTYQTEHIPISPNHFMTLKKEDLQNFFKRLRKQGHTFKYFAVGEYGGLRKRPHYHIILMGDMTEQNVVDAWTLNGEMLGGVNIGSVSGNSIAYTLKYIDKEKSYKHKRDDRKNEFSIMSKNLGKSWVTDEKTKYYRDDLKRLYVTHNEWKKALPKYYRNVMLSDREKKIQVDIVQKLQSEEEAAGYKKDPNYYVQKSIEKKAILTNFINRTKTKKRCID